jgi:hypothetical protein
MIKISFEQFLQESNYAESKTRNLSGAIKSTEEFLDDLISLQDEHDGIYAFLAYHPTSDKYVNDYISDDTLGSDAGRKIIALYLDQPALTPLVMPEMEDKKNNSVILDSNLNPAYELAARFFLDEVHPSLPGIIFLSELANPISSIYVCFSNESIDKVRNSIRQIFAMAQNHLSKDKSKTVLDFDKFASQLIQANIPYKRAGDTNLRSASFVVCAWLKINAKAILVALPKYAGLMNKQLD